jgi:hypothetical protein
MKQAAGVVSAASLKCRKQRGKQVGIIEEKTPPHLVPDMEKIRRMADRLEKAESLLKRAYSGIHKEHWREGESESEVCQAILAFLGSVPLHGGCIQSFDCNAGDHSDACPAK